MHARVTSFTMDASRYDEIMDVFEGVKSQIDSLPGLLHMTNTMDRSTGAGTVTAVYENEESANENMDKVQAIWANFAEFMTSEPERSVHEVIHIYSAS